MSYFDMRPNDGDVHPVLVAIGLILLFLVYGYLTLGTHGLLNPLP